MRANLVQLLSYLKRKKNTKKAREGSQNKVVQIVLDLVQMREMHS